LESSLDILRKYKPDYTPRTGFAWPITETMEGPGGKANKKRPGTDDSQATGSAGTSGEPLPDADPDLIKKLEKERALTHPKKQQNTALLLNAMRTTAAHPFQMFHEREAAAATTTISAAAELQHQLGAPSEGVASEGQRSSATPAPALIPMQSAGSQSSYGPSASQDSSKGGVGVIKKKKKRMYIPLTWNIECCYYCMTEPLGRSFSCHPSTNLT
jgi:mediator of RNA polymerase II transcription subunit 6